jgi:tetratricopeptide (TPR) repeat protein
MSCYRLSVAIALAVFVAAVSGSAYAQTSATARADELLARGQREFAEGKYADAIETLRSGYVIGNQARFLYALGQAYRMNHQCKEAVKAYREFIKSQPSKTQIAAAEANVGRCGDEDPSSLAEPLPPKPEPVVAPVAAVVAPAPPPRKPTYKKWWPWTLMTVGLVGVGLGVGLGIGLKKSGSSFDTTLPEVGPNAMR